MGSGFVEMDCDVLIAGCGVAGLYAALNLPESMRVIMLSKGLLEECDSMLAQGGICVLPEAGDYDSFVEDTLRAGHHENRRESVDIMVRSSRSVLNDLIALGVEFERCEDGSLAFTREGAHARPRICYHADTTGKAITTVLLDRVKSLPNVSVMERVAMVDLIETKGICTGAMARRVDERAAVLPVDELDGALRAGEAFAIHAKNVIMATGGIGGVYEHSTNYPQLTGDACYIARKHGVALEHLDYVQIHPTGLYSDTPGRTFLISESCRGEGAVLLNRARKRFTDELQPRDVVAHAIQEQMRKDGTPYVWLSFDSVAPETVKNHFAGIYEHCLREEGRDILAEPIPVVPTQHYFMGGVRVDRDAATSMACLYAAGETACNGVHGANRLASNSLLESLVFARRAAYRIATGKSLEAERIGAPALDGCHRRIEGAPSALDRLSRERLALSDEALDACMDDA